VSTLERVLQELERVSAMAAAPAGGLEAATEALNRRQRAIADLARLIAAPHTLSHEECKDALRRLRLVNEAAAGAEQWLVDVKRDAMAEWNQWSHIYRALGATSDTRSTLVDYRG
jgi:hypothetical protein